MWCHQQITSVSINNRWTNWCIGIDSTINTISNSYKVRGDTYYHVFTFIYWACFIYSSNHNCAVSAVCYLNEGHVCINVNMRILTIYYSDIFILKLTALFYNNAFILSIHIDYFVLRLVRGNNLPKPINNQVHMNLNWMISSLKEWSQSWQWLLSYFNPWRLLNFE